VKAKDRLRSIALHTRVLENWARHDYDRMKGHRVPGTNFMQISETEAANLYDQFLDRLFLTRVRAMCCPFSCCSRVMMAGPGDTMTGVLFQVAFEKYADARGIPLLGTADALSQGDPQSSDLHPYFLDHAHLAEQGAAQGGGGPSSISAQGDGELTESPREVQAERWSRGEVQSTGRFHHVVENAVRPLAPVNRKSKIGN